MAKKTGYQYELTDKMAMDGITYRGYKVVAHPYEATMMLYVRATPDGWKAKGMPRMTARRDGLKNAYGFGTYKTRDEAIDNLVALIADGEA